MQCEKCNFENRESAKFCIKCGFSFLDKQLKKVLSEEEKEKKQLKKQRQRKIFKKLALILIIISALCVGAYFANEYYKEIQYQKERSIKLAIIKEKKRVLQEKEEKERAIRLEKERIIQQKKYKKRLADQKKADDFLQSIADEMIKVEGGTFIFGEKLIYGKPAKLKVTLDDYYIGKYEVTQLQWKTIMGSNPSYHKGDQLPVERVSFEMVQEFIRELNSRSKNNFKLPTEAQWEFAFMGGNKSMNYESDGAKKGTKIRYSGSSNIDEVAWHSYNSGEKSHPVGQKKANELGIYDMSGNVQEFCHDYYTPFDDDYYLVDSRKNPTGPPSPSGYDFSLHVLRGGAFIYSSGYFHSLSQRGGGFLHEIKTKYRGFRLVLLK